MFDVFKKQVLPIGVDLGSNHIRMVQLEAVPKGFVLIGAAYGVKPENIDSGGPEWQKWAIQTVRGLFKSASFKGKSVVTALPSDDIFIDQFKVPRASGEALAGAIHSKIRHKLPFDAAGAAVKYVIADQASGLNGEVGVVVMAAEQRKIEHHLAIYEKAGLQIRSITVWPEAMINTYVNFFSRRKEEQELIAMLIEVGSNHTNIAICRDRSLLFARMITIGYNQISKGELVHRLIAEIDACCRYFESVSNGLRIQRLMLLAGRNIEKDICEQVAQLAQKLQVPAQIGDVLGAVEMDYKTSTGNVDRRDGRINWSMSFGLSLAARGR